jgi:hypothetical protein
VKEIFAIIKKGIGIFLGALLLVIGGGIGLEDLQAPRTINIPIIFFSLAAILVGSIILWMTFRKNENRYTKR